MNKNTAIVIDFGDAMRSRSAEEHETSITPSAQELRNLPEIRPEDFTGLELRRAVNKNHLLFHFGAIILNGCEIMTLEDVIRDVRKASIATGYLLTALDEGIRLHDHIQIESFDGDDLLKDEILRGSDAELKGLRTQLEALQFQATDVSRDFSERLRRLLRLALIYLQITDELSETITNQMTFEQLIDPKKLKKNSLQQLSLERSGYLAPKRLDSLDPSHSLRTFLFALQASARDEQPDEEICERLEKQFIAPRTRLGQVIETLRSESATYFHAAKVEPKDAKVPSSLVLANRNFDGNLRAHGFAEKVKLPEVGLGAVLEGAGFLGALISELHNSYEEKLLHRESFEIYASQMLDKLYSVKQHTKRDLNIIASWLRRSDENSTEALTYAWQFRSRLLRADTSEMLTPMEASMLASGLAESVYGFEAFSLLCETVQDAESNIDSLSSLAKMNLKASLGSGALERTQGRTRQFVSQLPNQNSSSATFQSLAAKARELSELMGLNVDEHQRLPGEILWPQPPESKLLKYARRLSSRRRELKKKG